MKKIKISLPVQIIIGLILGIVFALTLGRYVKYISWIGEIFLRLLQMVVIPIIFSSMVVGVAGIGKSSDVGRIAGKTITFYVATTLLATVIGLTLVNIINPGEAFKLGQSVTDTSIVGGAPDALAGNQMMAASGERQSLGDVLISIFPKNIFRELGAGNILAIIFFAIVFGLFLTKAEDKSRNTLLDIFQSIFDVVLKMTLAIIKLAPLGVFSIVAKMITAQTLGADGNVDWVKLGEMASSLGLFLAVVWGGCLFHFFVVMPTIVKTLGKENPYKHMRKMSTAILTAFSTCSSGATLPISLRDSEHRCGISNKIASFTLPLGATINMNGTALYECAAVVFIAQVYGIEMSIAEQIIVAITVLFSAIGAAGIPMAGLVMLSVALSVAGLPMEGIGIVLAVEQLCDMPRTATNCYGDMCAAVVIAKSEGETLTIDDPEK